MRRKWDGDDRFILDLVGQEDLVMKRGYALAYPFVMFAAARRGCVAWVIPCHSHSRTAQRSIRFPKLLSFIPNDGARNHFSSSRRHSSNQDLDVDDQGRRMRRRGQNDGTGWDDFNPVAAESVSGAGSTGGWDDFDPLADAQPFERSPAPRRQRDTLERRESDRDRRGNNRGRDDRRRDDRNGNRSPRHGNNRKEQVSQDRKINLKAIEGAGFVHLYGLASVLNALHANRRDFTRPEDLIDLDELLPDDRDHELKQRQRKPEAQFSPWLFIQERGSRGGRSLDKTMAAEQVEYLAQERGIPVATVDKGVLNTLSGNRPHQGYVLRCGKLNFETLVRVPHPGQDPMTPSLWLVLDEVVDPQNLGALLRSAHFLGAHKLGLLVCAKNSAPPSPVVSAASAGALELATVFETSNLPRTLTYANQDGFRILGASSSLPRDTGASLYELNDLPPDDRPTLLVLGSEGHGLRTLVAKACTDFVRIPGGSLTDAEQSAVGVDSLNVSVTGGILLWHLLQSRSR